MCDARERTDAPTPTMPKKTAAPTNPPPPMTSGLPSGMYRADVKVSLRAFSTLCMTAATRTLPPDATYNHVNGKAISETLGTCPP